jgi:hypothetical protein
LNISALVYVELPREDEGIIYAGDHEISNRVAETLIAAITAKNLQIFLDTFVDHDRGYYPRNGLLDRRYNPRSSYYVLYHLYSALGGDLQALKIRPIETSAGIRAFTLHTSQYGCALLLPNENAGLGQITLWRLARIGARGGVGKWLDLRTGKVKKVPWTKVSSDDDRIVFELPFAELNPALLVFKDAHPKLE